MYISFFLYLKIVGKDFESEDTIYDVLKNLFSYITYFTKYNGVFLCFRVLLNFINNILIG